MAETITGQFVDCILAVRYGDLPAEVIDISRQVVLDGLAVTLAGATEPLGVGRIATEYVKELGGAPDASVVAGGATGELQSIFAYFTNDTFARFVLFVLTVVFLRIRPQGLFAPFATRR